MNEAEFRESVLALKDRVYGYARSLLREREEAEDVAQETFVKLWEHRERVPDLPSAKAWSFRTAHNLAIDRLRSARHRRQVDDEGFEERRRDEGPGPERAALGREGMRRVFAALDGIAPEDKALLLLREVHELSYEELRGVLNVPMGTLKARLFRARHRLRARLESEGVTP